jgi:hypothetical protein
MEVAPLMSIEDISPAPLKDEVFEQGEEVDYDLINNQRLPKAASHSPSISENIGKAASKEEQVLYFENVVGGNAFEALEHERDYSKVK